MHESERIPEETGDENRAWGRLSHGSDRRIRAVLCALEKIFKGGKNKIFHTVPYNFNPQPWTKSGNSLRHSGIKALRQQQVTLQASTFNLISSFFSSSSSSLLLIHVHSFLFFFLLFLSPGCSPSQPNGATPFLSPPSPLQACCRLRSEFRLRVVTYFFLGVLSPLSRLSFDDSTVHNIPSLHSFGSGSSSSELLILSVDVRRYAAQTRDAPHYLTPYRLCAAPPVRHFDSHSQGNPLGFF